LKLCDKIIKEFDILDENKLEIFDYFDYRADGVWILPDGRLLKTGNIHSDVGGIYEKTRPVLKEKLIPSFTQDYQERCRTIRVGWYALDEDGTQIPVANKKMAEEAGIPIKEVKSHYLYAESYHKPTKQQVDTLVKLFKNMRNPEANFERSETMCALRIDRPLDIQRWISKCW